jgi:hypothetical protein
VGCELDLETAAPPQDRRVLQVNEKLVVGLLLMGTMLAGCTDRGARTNAPPPIEAAPAVVAPAAPVPTQAAPIVTRPAPAPSEPAVAAPLRIKRLVLATGVSGREPEGAAKIFRQGDLDKLYAFVEVENRTREPAEITVTFEPPQGRSEHGNVKLAVGGHPRWRTWAYTRTARQVGSWTAVVKDERGRTLARAPFEIAL